MSVSHRTAMSILKRLADGADPEQAAKVLTPRLPAAEPLPPRLPAGNEHNVEALHKRLAVLAAQGIDLAEVSNPASLIDPTTLETNIENLVGCARLPIGVVGPLRVNGFNAHGDFYVPLATSEGALVASYNRGAYVIGQAGGAAVASLTDSVSRAPAFVFRDMNETLRFLAWVLARLDVWREVVGEVSNHCELIDLQPTVSGKDLFLNLVYKTGEAAGQNMVTLVTEAICRRIVDLAPIKPHRWYIEGNMSGDKKATMLSFIQARGKKVVAETILPEKLVQRFLRTTPQEMMDYWEISIMGGTQSGSIGVQGHYANALAAMFAACGQDIACVAEAAVGLTRLDVTPAGELYVSVSLPNVIVGTVGGGTALPTARECLKMMGCDGPDASFKLAEICGATALAGEISIIGSMAAGDFAQAHQSYGRKSGPSGS